MKPKALLPALVIGAAALLFAACPYDSKPSITKAEYVNETTFIVYYLGDVSGIPFFNVAGKEKRYDIKSCETHALLDIKATCVLDGRFQSGDHITITSDELSGSAEFDVPGGE